MQRRVALQVLLLSLAGSSLPAMKDRTWQTLLLAQKDLFPAIERFHIDTDTYMRYIFSHPKIKKSTKRFMLQGAKELGSVAVKKFGKNYLELTSRQRNLLLRDFTKSGTKKRWALVVMRYGVEACFSDPVYGTNRDGASWRWIGYTPGLPRPKVKDGP